jgi:SecD/SecF fusion protein
MELGADKEQTMAILDAVQSSLSETPVWPSSNKIGGQVAGDTQAMAVAAILASLLGIVIYLWIRFQRVSFGLAAVVALVHDVTITVGAVAVSYWLQNILGFAQVIEFKISLPVVAALLTIIGYSLNDTIVVFDRIREVRGKSRELTSDMVNRSVNQTLSRTLLTSGTTLIVVAILYFFGGEGVHGFAFALLVGIVVGTYSSIFVASPVLLWLMNRKSASTSKPAAKAAV